MSGKLNAFLLIIILATAMASCNKDFLNTTPQDRISSSVVWTDAALATAYVNGVYNDNNTYGLGNGGFDEQMLASLSDEAIFTHSGRSINIINEGLLSPDNVGWVSGTYDWSVMYKKIRAANLGLENLFIATFDDADLNNRLRGECYFLRAYFYQQLLRYYGGVPIIDYTYTLEDDYAIARSSYEDCVNFILADCDSAAILLDGRDMEKGRASKIAALALKSRVLLYAASDLHDMPTAKANSSVISSYSNPELLGYTSGDRTARWEAAKEAAKAVLDEGGGGYKLTYTAPVTAEEGTQNYMSIAMGGGSSASGVDASAEVEILFGRYFVAEKDEGGIYIGLDNGPNGYHCWAGNTPIQELVDDYEMMDGSAFSWSNSEEKAHPYNNRDPRFYATILYDGADWKPRDLISGNVDPANQIQTGQYQVASGYLSGLDTRQSSIEDWNGSWTGYYMRKFIDPDNSIVDNTTRAYIPWPFFRYTEAVFNYAEACIELGEDDEAKTWLNKIRFRAGMPAITETGDALKERYRNERRIEMAYEEQRYHDARRWMIASTTLGRKVVYINVVGKLKSGQTALSTYQHDETRYDYTYTPTEVNALENRTWVDKMYFRPITRDEMNKNDQLVQNPGY
ncbi:RagB/SusD family nutrient uptake outer membrane protein [Parafilimonas sp.]|uniref:RagB/SusD family nutrient uptake outer membrane protein n=1 Tax=Parafilimonas sp. TaxID=1969739 RepID=UPI0039E5A688